MNILKKTFLLVGLAACLLVRADNSENPYHYLYKDLPFEMPVVHAPVFSGRQLLITETGGVGDGITLNTTAFEEAMSRLEAAGGGTLLVPFGVWHTGPIVLRSNIRLHLEKGALILFTSDRKAYPLIKTVYEGQETFRCQSPISGKNLVNIAITGKGTINGSGESWRPLKRPKVTEAHWKEVVASGGVLKNKEFWFPSEGALKAELMVEQNGGMPTKNMTVSDWEEIRDYLRPVMVSLVSCKNVLLQGVLFENSPSWNIHPLMCENIIVDGVFIRNPAYAQNGDGLDLESCKNAIVVNSVLDVGDDAICLKSGKDEEGRLRARPTENVIVDNCTVFKGHGGFVVGSEMSGGVRNVSVSNCNFIGTDVGLRFKSTRGRGGVVENIFINNISMLDIRTDSFLFDLYYATRGEQSDIQPVSEATPIFRNIYVKNLVSRNAGRAMFFNGLPEMNITNINVENASITARLGAELSESDGVSFRNVHVTPDEGPAFLLNNVKNFRSAGLSYPEGMINPIDVKGGKNIQVVQNRIIEN